MLVLSSNINNQIQYHQFHLKQSTLLEDARLQELQVELLKLAGSKADYEDVADEIYRLREEKQKVQLESAGRDGLKKRITDMSDFLRTQPTALPSMMSHSSGG